MDIAFILDTFKSLIAAMPLTLELAACSLLLGSCFSLLLAAARVSDIPALDWPARAYIFAFRGTPLLVQIFLIYYGLGQFPSVRHSMFWPVLREPYWCAVIALMLNTAAYSAEIMRGGFLSVPSGQIEAARACGMPPWMIYRRITFPLAVKQALPGYGNEIISIVKATSLASIITLMEITGVAAKIISDTYRVTEVFIVAACLYLAINFVLTRLVALADHYMNPEYRSPKPSCTGEETSWKPI